MLDQNTFVEQTLLRLLEQKKYHSLRDILATMNPSDIAYLLEELDERPRSWLPRPLWKWTAISRTC